MDQKIKDLITAIQSEPPYVNPTKDLYPQVSSLAASNQGETTALITAIDDSIPLPPPTIPPGDGEPVKIIPPLEQDWMDRLSAVGEYCMSVSAGCQTCNDHMIQVVGTFSENIGLHSMGASVIEEMEGGGTDKFNQAYELVSSTALSSMNGALALLTDISDNMPPSYSIDTMESLLTTLEAEVGTGLNYNQLYDQLITTENNIKAELVQAARDYVLATQSQSWAGADHTAAVIAATGSAALKEALE